MNKKIKDFTGQFADLNYSIQLFKYAFFFMVICNLVLCMCLIKAINRQQLIIGIDEEKGPVPVKIIDEKYDNLVYYQQFLTDFLERAYCWTPETFENQISSVLPLIDDTSQDEFLTELRTKNAQNKIMTQELTNILVVKYIDVDSILPTEEGWLINVDAIKLRLTEVNSTKGVFSTKPLPVRFTIGFKTAPLSRENIWGFKVYLLDEQEILS